MMVRISARTLMSRRGIPLNHHCGHALLRGWSDGSPRGGKRRKRCSYLAGDAVETRRADNISAQPNGLGNSRNTVAARRAAILCR